MLNDEELYKIIYDSIDEINSMIASGKQINKQPDTLISENENELDSLDILNFLVILEQKIEMETGRSISFVDDEALSYEINPLESVRTIKDFIKAALE